MTTVLHRSTRKEHLEKDYVIKSKATKGIDDVSPESKRKTIEITQKIAKIIFNHHPVNMGQGRVGCLGQGKSIDEIIEGLKNLGGLSASIFDNKAAVIKALGEIKARESGQSITVAGAIEQIFDICKELGTEPHTAIVPLGIWGKTDLLPRKGIKELTMMCGHGLISAHYCEYLVEQVKNKSLTCNEAVNELSRVCICGAFNVTVAKDIFKTDLVK